MSSTLIAHDSNPRSNVMWKRLLWKERRELTPVWMAIMLIGFFGLVMIAFQASSPEGKKEIVRTCLYSFTAILSATLAIVGFASESENETLGRLQNLPLHPRSVGGLKLVAGAIATLAGTLLLALLVPVLCSAFGFSLNPSQEPLPLLLLLVGSLLVYFIAAAIAMAYGSMGKSLFLVVALFLPFLFWLDSSHWHITEYLDGNFGFVLLIQLALGVVAGLISVVRLVPWVEGRGLNMRKVLGPAETTSSAGHLASVSASGAASGGAKIFWTCFFAARLLQVAFASLYAS